jgi:hypothetical protein
VTTFAFVLLAAHLLVSLWMFGVLVRRAGWLGALALGFLAFAWPVALIDRFGGRRFGGS